MLSSLKKKQNHSEIFMSERVGKMLNFPFAVKLTVKKDCGSVRILSEDVVMLTLQI